jgi:hypothetical protein
MGFAVAAMSILRVLTRGWYSELQGTIIDQNPWVLHISPLKWAPFIVYSEQVWWGITWYLPVPWFWGLQHAAAVWTPTVSWHLAVNLLQTVPAIECHLVLEGERGNHVINAISDYISRIHDDSPLMIFTAIDLHLKCKVHEFPDSSWPVCRFDLPNTQRPCQSQDEFSLPHLKLIGKWIDFLELDYQGHDETSISSISGRKVPNLQRITQIA